MRLVGGSLAFPTALFFGVFGTWVWADFAAAEIDMTSLADPNVIKVTTACNFSESVATTVPEGIVVKYSGTATDVGFDDTYLSFLIRNNTRELQTYSALLSTSPFPILKADGKVIHLPQCCSMGEWYSIPSGSSLEVRVYASDFRTRPAKYARISAGFRLGPFFEKTSTTYYSKPFRLPEEFRKSIKKN